MEKPKSPPTAEENYASTMMVVLIVEALRDRSPHLVPPELASLDSIRHARTSMDQKRQLLANCYDELGPDFVFEIGGIIRRLPFNPLLDALLRSRSGDSLLSKWSRYECYGHSLHRTQIDKRGPAHYRLQHHSMTGPPPGPDHDLFILGVLVALLEAIGARKLEVSLLPGDRALLQDGKRVYRGTNVFGGVVSQWRLLWSPSSHEACEANGPAVPPETPETPATRARDLLAADPSHTWSLSETARALGLSPRSLQRRLSEEATSFSAVVRSVRVSAACRLLESTDYALTEVGYLCGFADAAHFSRDFRASTGASPSQFRAAAGDIE